MSNHYDPTDKHSQPGDTPTIARRIREVSPSNTYIQLGLVVTLIVGVVWLANILNTLTLKMETLNSNVLMLISSDRGQSFDLNELKVKTALLEKTTQIIPYLNDKTSEFERSGSPALRDRLRLVEDAVLLMKQDQKQPASER